MKIFCTHLNAIDKSDGIIKKFDGNRIMANSWDEAEQICKEQFPYLTVYGRLVCELDEKTLKEINLNLN